MLGKKTKVKDDIKTWNKRWQMFMFVVITTILSFCVSGGLYLSARMEWFILDNIMIISIPFGILGVLSAIFGFIITGYLLKMTKKDVKGYKKKGKQEFSVIFGQKPKGFKGFSMHVGWYDAFVAIMIVPVLITYIVAITFGIWKWFWIFLGVFAAFSLIKITIFLKNREPKREERKVKKSKVKEAKIIDPRPKYEKYSKGKGRFN